MNTILPAGAPLPERPSLEAARQVFATATPVILLTGWRQRLAAEGDVPPRTSIASSPNRPDCASCAQRLRTSAGLQRPEMFA